MSFEAILSEEAITISSGKAGLISSDEGGRVVSRSQEDSVFPTLSGSTHMPHFNFQDPIPSFFFFCF